MMKVVRAREEDYEGGTKANEKISERLLISASALLGMGLAR